MESPPLRLDQLVKDVLNRHTLAVWCSEYDLVRKMRTKDGYSLDSEEEKAQIFCAFIGGVLVDSDFSDIPVRSWLSGIMGRDVPVEEAAPLSKKLKLEKVSPKASPVIPPRYLVPTGQYQPDMVSAQPPIPHYAGGIQIGPESVHQKQFSSVMANDWTMSGNGGHLNQPIVPGIGVSPTLATHPAPYYPPPILGTPSLPPLATSPKGAPQPKTFLMKFNERIAQKKLKHEWQCKQEGWAHDGTWLVDCLVNGVVTGRARAKTKKSAKELAAQDASRNMSWIM
ncbi:hypothetical protein DL96DRAFT_1575289 [Flagelloscypha sp. PMI_526]|nr:hypothetical protein DL96DRAFT_1575289 [Flagelloscypha sp. PMI_526]